MQAKGGLLRLIFFGVVASAGILFVQSAPALSVVPVGEVTGRCVGWPSPHIEIEWSDAPPAGSLSPNVNSVLRSVNGDSAAWFFGGGYPGVSGIRISGAIVTPWNPDYPYPNYTVHDLRDDSVIPGNTYTYRAKYRPETASSNLYTVQVNAGNCGAAASAPVINPIPSPSPEDESQPTGSVVKTGIGAVCTWNGSAPEVHVSWTPATGSGTSTLQKGDLFQGDPIRYWGDVGGTQAVRLYNDRAVTLNTRYQYRVAYADGSVSPDMAIIFLSRNVCGVPFSSTPQSLHATPAFQAVYPGDVVSLKATGGSGGYVWSTAPGGTIYGSGSDVSVIFTNATEQSEYHTVTVRSGSESSTVSVEVLGVPILSDSIRLTSQPLSTAASIAINDDAATTTKSAVVVALDHGFSGVLDTSVTVRLANTLAGLSSAAEQPFAGRISWDICGSTASCSYGLYTVYAQFATNTLSTRVFDTIIYEAGTLVGNPSIAINSGAVTTGQRMVGLTLSHGFSGVVDEEVSMRIAPTMSGLALVPVQLYAPFVDDWDLCMGESACPSGMKTVFVQFCTTTICAGPVQAAINLDQVATTAPAGILINSGASATDSRFVRLALANPFNATQGVLMRPANEGTLDARDRDLVDRIFNGGIYTPTLVEARFISSSSTRRALSALLGSDDNVLPELSSGTPQAFVSSTSWDLCAGASLCPYGEYKVLIQYRKTVLASPGVLGAVGDEISQVYADTITYAADIPSPTPTPSQTLEPSAIPTVGISPSPTPDGGDPQAAPGSAPGTQGPTGGSGSTGSSTLPSWIPDQVQNIIESLSGAVVPISAVSSVATVAMAVSTVFVAIPILGASGAFPFVWQWFMGALGILPKRKKVWGTVYDAHTKRPVPFAKVQLVDRSRRVLETRIADKDGRYGFLTSPESLLAHNVQIAIVPAATGYQFPSHLPATIDTFVYNNLYYGEIITVSQDTLINFDIPIDPIEHSQKSFVFQSPSIALGASVAAIADAGFWLGLIMVPLNFAVNPNPFTLGTLFLFLGTASLRLFGLREHPYGTVTDHVTGQAMPFSLVTLNDSSTGKRIAFAVSDERGRYFLVVERGSYQLTVATSALVQPPRRTTIEISAKKGWITRALTV